MFYKKPTTAPPNLPTPQRFGITAHNKMDKPIERERQCKRVVKRDEQGRIREEKFIGCNKEEIRMIRDSPTDNEI